MNAAPRQRAVPGAAAGCRLPERVGEFGPFDVVSDWAHARYVQGFGDEALELCRQALPLVDRAGDVRTGYYLRYIACLAYELQARWSQLRQQAEALLANLGAEAGPYWRAKVLGMHSHALIQQGAPAAAVDGLAAAYGLIMDHPGTAYNRGSACHAVATPMRAALLFEPAVDLLRTAQQMQGNTGSGAGYAAVAEATTLGNWGLMLELLGDAAAANARFASCASAAVRAQRLSGEAGDLRQAEQAAALLQFAYQRLGCDPVDERALRAEVLGGSGRPGLLPRLALVSVRAQQGDLGACRAGLEQIRRDADRFRELVPGWVAGAWLAELEERERGGTAATRRWRELALNTLERLWRDREGRFEHLLDRHGVATLSRQVASDHTRLWEDALTGVGNRRMLEDLLATQSAAARPVAFLDVDRFKAINDRHGHEVGDEVLRRLAAVLRSLSRAGDAVVRYGGDEFAVLLAEDGDVEVMAERIRSVVGSVDWGALARGLRVEVTVGVAVAGPDALARADRAMLALRGSGAARAAVGVGAGAVAPQASAVATGVGAEG